MKTKFIKYTLQGEYSVDDAFRTLGDAAMQGLVVRVDNIAGQTHLYIAVQGAVAAISPKKTATPIGVKVEEVSEPDIVGIV
jgi:hypothetical protein